VGDCSIGDSEQYATYDSSYHSTIDEKGYAWPFSLVHEYLAADDLTIANLEVVFTERRAHTDKVYNMVGAPDHVNVLLEGSVEVVNTVNNHCMDFHRNGYQDTLDILTEAGVEHFGTIYPWQDDGYDILLVKEVDSIRFGFMGFSYPADSDLKRIANRVKILKEEQGCDVVIVSLHWGRETHPTPTAGNVSFAKEVIKAGADVIWGHHPHVLQSMTFYMGKPIMFSTGNFTFGTMSQVDPATGIFQLKYERVGDAVQLKQLQVIPCQTQPSPDFRPFVLTEEAARKDVFKKLVYKKGYAKCDNPPESFLETGIVNFENGVIVP
jgi:poly-gamma-glutamate synthesis protein (capsule biosynthesis protein)